MATVGFARVSSIGQNLDPRLGKLREYGGDEIFQEKRSGRTAARPALRECLRHVRRRDVLVITRLDRLACSTLDLHRILEQLQENDVGFVVLDQAIDTTIRAGKLVFGILASVAEFELHLRKERQTEGISRARIEGMRFGLPPKLTKAAEFGIEITGESGYSIKDREFGPIVAKVKSDNPDAIYASGYFFTTGPLVRQIRAAGITAPVIGQEGYDSQKFIEIAGPDAEGVIITTSLDRDSTNPITQAFIRGFEEKAGYPTDMAAASAHTAILVMAEALKKAGASDGAALRSAIAETSVDASTGHISFNALGEVKKDVQVQVVKDGAWRHYAVISDPVLLAPPEQYPIQSRLDVQFSCLSPDWRRFL